MYVCLQHLHHKIYPEFHSAVCGALRTRPDSFLCAKRHKEKELGYEASGFHVGVALVVQLWNRLYGIDAIPCL